MIKKKLGWKLVKKRFTGLILISVSFAIISVTLFILTQVPVYLECLHSHPSLCSPSLLAKESYDSVIATSFYLSIVWSVSLAWNFIAKRMKFKFQESQKNREESQHDDIWSLMSQSINSGVRAGFTTSLLMLLPDIFLWPFLLYFGLFASLFGFCLGMASGFLFGIFDRLCNRKYSSIFRLFGRKSATFFSVLATLSFFGENLRGVSF
jgi:hypothetical protein